MSGSASQERLIVFVAHPDDETFGCGSLLASAAARGVDCTVVCATRGEAGEPAPDSGVGPDDLATTREAELHEAAALLGVSRVEVLDWHDSGMGGPPPEGSLAAARVSDVADRLVPFIDRIRPTIVVTLDGSDGHRDHAQIRDATLLALDGAEWSTPRAYLHCLPQELMQEWADIVRSRDPDSAYVVLASLGTAERDITTVLDTSHLLEVREAAIAAHRSQTSPYEVMPDELRAAFLSSERLRRVRPPWAGGPVETDPFSSTAVLADPMPG